MADSIQFINSYLDQLFMHGPLLVYSVIFAACFIENIIPPFPGDSFIVAAGILAALSRLDTVVVLLIVIAGGMCSVSLLFFIGRKYGRDYLIRRNFRYFTDRDMEIMEKRLKRWGGLILIVSRFVVGFRSALAVAAGVARYPASLMLLYSTISYLLFTGLILYITSTLVGNVEVIEQYFTTYHLIMWPIAIAAALIYILHIIRRKRNRQSDSRST